MSLSGFVLVWAAAIPGDLREEYHLDFRGGRSLPPEVQPVISSMMQWINPERDGLRIRLSSNRPSREEVELATDFAIHGDFEITAAYQVLRTETPNPGFGVGMTLGIKKADPSPETATVAWVVRDQGKQMAAWEQTRANQNGRVRNDGGQVGSSARSGRLRLRRTGSILTYLLADATTPEDFHEIQQCDFGSEDLERVVLRVVTSRPPCMIDARWVDFHIRSEGLPSMAQPPSSGFIFWFSGVLSGLVLLLGIIWMQWSRRQPTPSLKVRRLPAIR